MLRKHSRILAFLLLLVFSQRAGLRLWMHHWFHEGKTTYDRTASAPESLKLTCDCFDDAMMPLLESPLIFFPAPVRHLTALTVDRPSPILSTGKVYCSLKGPPNPSERA